jgi:hypothetical protein
LDIYNRCGEWLGEWEVQIRECLSVCWQIFVICLI